MSDLIDRLKAIDAIDGTLLDEVSESIAIDILLDLPSEQPEIIRCKDCKYSEHWYRDKRRCFLWVEDGIDVFDDGFCNYAKRRTMSDLIDRQTLKERLMYMARFRCNSEIGEPTCGLTRRTMFHMSDIMREVVNMPNAGREWLHDLLQDAIDDGIITETQASRLMDMINDSEDNT